MMPAAQSIVAEQVNKSFFVKTTKKTVQALHDISFKVTSGKITALIGPDGAGKTTFIRMVCGLTPPDSGKLTVLETDINQDPQSVQNRISYMPQKFGLYEDLSIEENMNLYARLHGVPEEQKQKRYQRLLSMTNLAAFTQRLAGNLSGGMKQKLGLACTLVRTPELLVLDEPTVGVDPLSRKELWEILTQMVSEEQLAVFLSTGYMDEAELCDYVVMLLDGSILAAGTPKELLQHAQNLCYILSPEQDIPARIIQSQLLDDSKNIIDAVPFNNAIRLILSPNSNLQDIAHITKIADVQPVQASLEDAFMVLVHKQNKNRRQQEFNKNAFAINKDFQKTDETIIEVKDLVKCFGNFTAVDKSTFTVKRGEIFGLLGPNGAGKTTTFRMLCGLIPATSGFLSVAGVDLRVARAEARAKVGYVAQKFSLYANLTVSQNLHFFGGAYGLPKDKLAQRMQEVKEQFGLQGQENRLSLTLPLGFQQRLSMATALLHQPEILFLDEPTSGIDPLARRIFWRQITSLASQGTTVIVTTHFMEEAEYCDRIMIQDSGKMLALGTPNEIRVQAGMENQNMNDTFIAIVEKARQNTAEATG